MKNRTRKPRTNKLRALQTKYKKLKQKSMAFFNRRRSFRRNRGYSRPRFSRPRFRSNNRIPYVGRIIPRALQPIIILAAIVGGVFYFFGNQLKPLIEKLKSHAS